VPDDSDRYNFLQQFSSLPECFQRQYSLLIHKDIEINSSFFMFVGGDISYSSEYNALVGDDPRFDIDSYAQTNLRGGIASTDETWRVSLWVNNVFDKEYSTSRVSSSDSTAEILARERRFGLTVSYNWSE
jgi:outer membrane receptor for ferric coprogen and ferric-rhodotorulic acid